jgi:hypothetical protein
VYITGGFQSCFFEGDMGMKKILFFGLLVVGFSATAELVAHWDFAGGSYNDWAGSLNGVHRADRDATALISLTPPSGKLVRIGDGFGGMVGFTHDFIHYYSGF